VSGPDLRIEPVRESRLPDVNELGTVAFSSIFSDHMLTATYSDGAWREALIRGYGPLSLSPNISALQYGISVFEGLKAHRTSAGGVAIFRPRQNALRLNRSAARLAMPQVPEELFMHGLRALVRLDREWVPPLNQGALYIRPCLFSIDPSVRVKPSEHCLLVIFTFPFGAYYSAPLDVMVSERYVRAFPGGTGDVKSAGNYASALLAEREAREAREAGFHTVLWLNGVNRTAIEECGVMNIFFVIDQTIVTPALEGTILPGVTRDCMLTLLRDMGMSVMERSVSIEEIVSAYDSGSLRECFGTGTAATLSHVRRIRYRDRDLDLPPVEERAIGPALHERFMAIATGQATDTHEWLEVV
jgi:branched-chain amino acid aminotransferase